MSPRVRREVPELRAEELEAYLVDHVPSEWFVDREVLVDDDEIVIVGRVEPAAGVDARAAIDAFREATRARRIDIAAGAEQRWRRKVAWGARSGDTVVLFTHLAVPAMTRLRMSERRVLDTLVAAGVARSRADALAWCVRLVDRNMDEWLGDLRDAMAAVDEVRGRGPSVD